MKMSYCIYTFLIMMLAVFSCGCVHEFPDMTEPDEFSLMITHDSQWNEFEYQMKDNTRSLNGWRSRYLFKVYPSGTTKIPSYEYEHIIDNADDQDFTFPMNLPRGDWDVYVWGEKVSDDIEFHNSQNFESIRYTDDYHGANDMREIFEGMTTISVGANGTVIDAEKKLTLHRPQGKYVFIATDYRDFVNDTLTPEGKSLDEFSAHGIYPLFMPSAYNMFTKRIIDSSRGMSYQCPIVPLDDDNAMIAYDHVFLNDGENAVQVQIALQSPDGTVHSLTSTLTIPLRRGHTTYVRGDFLRLPSGGGGVKIDITFSGEFNIEI